MKLIDKLAEDYCQKVEHEQGAYAESECEYATPLHPWKDQSYRLSGQEGFDTLVEEVYKAGMEKMRELVLQKSAGWFTEKQGDRLTRVEWQDFMKMVQQIANEEVEDGK